MSSDEVKLRGSARRRYEDYPLGEFPDKVIIAIAKQFVHRLAIGHGDITGDDLSQIFATAIEGDHRDSPLGIVDVMKENCAWSVKTIKQTKPFEVKEVRLISGRNSPVYSKKLERILENPATTGKAVLDIWNARINEALQEFEDLRVIVCVRNFATREFLVFEEEAQRFSNADYRWQFNKNNNLEGYNIRQNRHVFTWQPHGSQFTIKRIVPAHAVKFSITRSVPTIMIEHVLNLTKFDETWVNIIK